MGSQKTTVIIAMAEKGLEVIWSCIAKVCYSLPEIRMSLKVVQENI